MKVVLRRNSGYKGIAGKCYSKKYKSALNQQIFLFAGIRLGVSMKLQLLYNISPGHETPFQFIPLILL
jgi:hypothetical protein